MGESMMATCARLSLMMGGLALGGLLLASGCNPYRSDIGKLCDAEQLSQSSLKGNRAQIFAWMERHVTSSAGIILVKDLEGNDTRGIGLRLRDEARRAGVPSCALAEQAEMLAKDQDYQTDVTNLCAGSAAKADGSLARLDIVEADDAERMREIIEWSASNAKSHDTRAFIAKLAAAPPRQRGTLLRAEANRVSVASCLMAGTLDTMPRPPAPIVPVPNPTYTVLSVDAPKSTELAVATAFIGADVAGVINGCYSVALSSAPRLAGKAIIEVQYDPTDRLASKLSDGRGPVRGPMIDCIANGLVGRLAGAGHPEHAKKFEVHATVTLLFTPVVNAAGYTATIDPSMLGGSRPKHR
jgi:hypothetical protein